MASEVTITATKREAATSTVYSVLYNVRYEGAALVAQFNKVLGPAEFPSTLVQDQTILAGSGLTLAVPTSTVSANRATVTTVTTITVPANGATTSISWMSPAGSNTTTSSVPEPTRKPEGSSVSPGVVAGAAIGSLVAGALIALLICFFVMKRWQARRAQAVAPITVESKGLYAAGKPAGGSQAPQHGVIQLNHFLLDAIPKVEIEAELHSLSQLIRQHVENHYHLQPVNMDRQSLTHALMQLDLGKAGIGSLSPDAIAMLALDPNRRQVVLQHVISQVVFTSIDVPSRSRLSMLPAPIAAFLQSIPPHERGRANEEAYLMALNQWRALSAFLLHPARSHRTPLLPSAAATAPPAAALVNALDGFLGYFSSSGDETSRFQQRNHLQAVVGECTKFGYVILSQPGGWQFIHSTSTSDRVREAVVCAGLAKITDNDGTPFEVPQLVIAPTVVQV